MAEAPLSINSPTIRSLMVPLRGSCCAQMAGTRLTTEHVPGATTPPTRQPVRQEGLLMSSPRR